MQRQRPVVRWRRREQALESERAAGLVREPVAERPSVDRTRKRTAFLAGPRRETAQGCPLREMKREALAKPEPEQEAVWGLAAPPPERPAPAQGRAAKEAARARSESTETDLVRKGAERGNCSRIAGIPRARPRPGPVPEGHFARPGASQESSPTSASGNRSTWLSGTSASVSTPRFAGGPGGNWPAARPAWEAEPSSGSRTWDTPPRRLPSPPAVAPGSANTTLPTAYRLRHVARAPGPSAGWSPSRAVNFQCVAERLLVHASIRTSLF